MIKSDDLILALGSNIGDKKAQLDQAQKLLAKKWPLVAASAIYHSPAVGHTDQPSFYNQVLHFKANDRPENIMEQLLATEKELGRERIIFQGPRTIDIDLLFYGQHKIVTEKLTLPHPRLFERSFVVRPLSELAIFEDLKKEYDFPSHFTVEALPI